MILSDYQDLVMDLIKINMRDAKPLSDKCQLLATKLDWCEADKENYYENLEVIDKDGEVKSTLSQV